MNEGRINPASFSLILAFLNVCDIHLLVRVKNEAEQHAITTALKDAGLVSELTPSANERPNTVPAHKLLFHTTEVETTVQ